MKNNLMKALLLITVIAVSASCKSKTEKEEWVKLFNGTDLEGWTPKFSGYEAGVNYKNTFRVVDGVIAADYSEYETFNGEFGHLFYNEPFTSYKLKMEYRFLGEQVEGGASWAFRNSGVMFHSQSPESMLKDQDFPVSIEAQFLGGAGEGERPTGNLCTPGTHVTIDNELVTRHCTESSSKTFNGDQWVSFQLEVYGDSLIRHIVNGDTVLTYSKPVIGGELPEGYPMTEGATLSGGYISIQAESHPVQFRNIEIMKIGNR